VTLHCCVDELKLSPTVNSPNEWWCRQAVQQLVCHVYVTEALNVMEIGDVANVPYILSFVTSTVATLHL